MYLYMHTFNIFSNVYSHSIISVTKISPIAWKSSIHLRLFVTFWDFIYVLRSISEWVIWCFLPITMPMSRILRTKALRAKSTTQSKSYVLTTMIYQYYIQASSFTVSLGSCLTSFSTTATLALIAAVLGWPIRDTFWGQFTRPLVLWCTHLLQSWMQFSFYLQ